jgi:LuxR family maltose regulon positive regulatory protein
VPRARLIQLLLEARETPVALLVAPAGYGKTTVLSEWAASDPRPFAWVGLDAEHDDPRALMATIGDALGVRSTRTVSGLARHVGARSDPFVLVLDDVHELRAPEAYAVVSELARALPRGSQVALASRCEPGLAVGRLRAHRQVLELRTADLAMDRPEAAALLQAAGAPLGTGQVETLLERTEGWPAGLYLAALSIRAQPDVRDAVARFAGDDRVVADYLGDEILGSLSPKLTAFLLRTSLLDTLSGPLCDAVLGETGSSRVLAELARSNVLLTGLDRTGETYRYHPLFAEMLRAGLRRTEPEREAELHRRAAAWYGAGGDPRLATRHAVAAGDVGAAGELLWAHAPAHIAQGGNDTVRRWLGELADDQIEASAPLALVAAMSALAASDRGGAERWTAAAARSLERTGDHGSHAAALALLRAAAARDSLARMGADAARAAGSEPCPWRSTACLLEGIARHLTGNRDEARTLLEAGSTGGAVPAPAVQALCLSQLALLAIEEEDWDGAAVLTARARSQAGTGGLEDYPALALVSAVSGLVRAQRGMVEEAGLDLRRAARLASALGDFAPWYDAETRLALGRAALRLGDLRSARASLAEAAHLLRYTPDAVTLREWLERARTDLETATRSTGETCALTTAELRVLRLLPTHLSFPAIAGRLYVSPNTVKTHVRAVYRKLDASSRAEAVARASAAGLLEQARAA